jgi:hypothetical protein
LPVLKYDSEVVQSSVAWQFEAMVFIGFMSRIFFEM